MSFLQVSKANFKLLLLYLDGLRGNQRGLVRERAEKVVVQNESDKDTGKRSKRHGQGSERCLRDRDMQNGTKGCFCSQQGRFYLAIWQFLLGSAIQGLYRQLKFQLISHL